jgi:hypothetical protein
MTLQFQDEPADPRKYLPPPPGEERVIQIIGLINGGGTGFDGQFVVEYDPGRDGRDPITGQPMMCHLVTTPDIDKATRYSAVEAFELWRSVDPMLPFRADGQPNRPLTAFNVAIQPPDMELFLE